MTRGDVAANAFPHGAGDSHYWLAQHIEARLAAVEMLRRQKDGYEAGQRMERVCRIVSLEEAKRECPE